MPVHAKVRPLLGTYTEDDIVDYYCEYTDMKLIGNVRRKLREIPRRTLDRIEMVNLGNHSVSNIYYSHQLYYTSNYLSEYQKQQQMTFFGQPSTPGECIHSKVKANVTSLEWRLVFKWAIGQVYHVEIVVNTANMNQALDFRKNGSIVRQVYVSDYRVCKPEGTPEPVEVNEKLFKYTFVCELRDQSNVQKLEDFAAIRSEELMNVTIDFGVTDVTVCELHVSETLPIRYYSRGSCGSPDIPLYSTYGPVFDETSNGFIPIGYRFTCDNGFQLDGNQVVTCGVNNQWLDKFPTCLPIESCPLMDKHKLEELSLKVDYKSLYSADGNITAINGTQAIYSCDYHTKDDDTINKTMIGDSLHFCQINGNWTGEEPSCLDKNDSNWTGEEPSCLDKNDFTLYLAEINEIILTSESKLPEYAHHMHQPNQCGIPAIPKYSKIYTYDPNLISVYFAALKGKLDLMPSYPNGSVMTYGCESRFDYMASDFGARTCVNGSWVGQVGKCYTPVGGTEVAKVISIQENTGTANVSYHTIKQDISDKYWSYIETEESNCIKLEIKSGTIYTWTIYLSMPVRMSYFAVRFGNNKIFHDLEEDMLRVHRASQLDTPSPITAELFGYNYWSNKLECEVTKVIETSMTTGLTQVSFRCDEPDSEISSSKSKKTANPYLYYGYQMTTSAINIKINSDAFHESFDSTNTTHVNLCGLMLFKAADDCGLPEEVPNAEIISSHSEGYVRYKCNEGYQLVGNEIVRCSKLGNWMEVAVLGTIIEFTCQDDAYFGKYGISTESGGSSSIAVPMAIFTVIVLIIIGVAVLLVYRRYGFSNPFLTCMTRREPTRRSSTFISYGQSNLRDSVVSFTDGGSLSSANSYTNSNNVMYVSLFGNKAVVIANAPTEGLGSQG
ncbi:unnamed protein product [Oppiella nova]|uniref:Sushi domain-containing protein n=1 Tax=Oppiella nova TaxID=334625 RepID=A0A7R9QK12_9ACAR|nr:unnamed protein product [Oppiella nova]CAG2167377.1 unnamed protein product [Oppiella nova]